MNIIIGVKKMSDELGVSRSTIYRYINSGMPCSKANGKSKYIFEMNKVKEWLIKGDEDV